MPLVSPHDRVADWFVGTEVVPILVAMGSSLLRGDIQLIPTATFPTKRLDGGTGEAHHRYQLEVSTQGPTSGGFLEMPLIRWRSVVCDISEVPWMILHERPSLSLRITAAPEKKQRRRLAVQRLRVCCATQKGSRSIGELESMDVVGLERPQPSLSQDRRIAPTHRVLRTCRWTESLSRIPVAPKRRWPEAPSMSPFVGGDASGIPLIRSWRPCSPVPRLIAVEDHLDGEQFRSPAVEARVCHSDVPRDIGPPVDRVLGGRGAIVRIEIRHLRYLAPLESLTQLVPC